MLYKLKQVQIFLLFYALVLNSLRSFRNYRYFHLYFIHVLNDKSRIHFLNLVQSRKQICQLDNIWIHVCQVNIKYLESFQLFICRKSAPFFYSEPLFYSEIKQFPKRCHLFSCKKEKKRYLKWNRMMLKKKII